LRVSKLIGVFYSTTENPGKRSKTESVGWIVRHRATLATPSLAKAESAGPWPLLHLSLAEARENRIRSRQFEQSISSETAKLILSQSRSQMQRRKRVSLAPALRCFFLKSSSSRSKRQQHLGHSQPVGLSRIDRQSVDARQRSLDCPGVFQLDWFSINKIGARKRCVGSSGDDRQ
jgi:hypothetical protein